MAVCNERDWVGFSPRMGLNGGPREGPSVILFPAGPALQRCVGTRLLGWGTLRSSAWQTCSRQVSVLLLEVVLEGLMLWSVESRVLTERSILMRLKQPWHGLSAWFLQKPHVLVHVKSVETKA